MDRTNSDAFVSWYDLLSPSLPTSAHLQPHLPALHFNSKAYLCSYAVPTVGLTSDQHWTHSDCHGMTSFPLLCLPPTMSACTPQQLQSIPVVYLHNLMSWYDFVSPPLSASDHVCLCSTTTLKYTYGIPAQLVQLHCAYCRTNLRSRPNLPGPSSHTKGHRLYTLSTFVLLA